MKIGSTVLLGLFMVSILTNIWLVVRVKKIEQRINTPGKTTLSQEKKCDTQKEDYELSEAMAYNQRFIEKLYFAGSNNNWELADFYFEELEEKIEDIVKHNIVEDTVEISSLIKKVLYPKIEAVEKSIEKQNQRLFQQSFVGLIEGCNTCHTSAKHGFVQIQVPKFNSYPSQVFNNQNPIK